jgi:hypothetical protein
MQGKDFGHESFSCAERMHRREEKRDEKKDICDECCHVVKVPINNEDTLYQSCLLK